MAIVKTSHPSLFSRSVVSSPHPRLAQIKNPPKRFLQRFYKISIQDFIFLPSDFMVFVNFPKMADLWATFTMRLEAFKAEKPEVRVEALKIGFRIPGNCWKVVYLGKMGRTLFTYHPSVPYPLMTSPLYFKDLFCEGVLLLKAAENSC